MKKKVWILRCGLLVSLHFLFAQPLIAQDENTEPPPEQEEAIEPALTDPATESTAPADSGIRQSQPQTIEDLDSFVPSEEVSSDLSISYPVDI